jgi:Domain of unknown function (DUF4394)
MATTRHTFRPQLEALEDRRNPSVLYALNAAGTALLRFNSAAPAALTNVAPVLGLQPGETLRGIDFRPRTGQLYGLGITDTPGPDTGRLYQLNGLTGVATPVAAGASPFSTALADGASYGFDFNPVVDVIRVINSAGQNLRFSPNTGLALATDTNLTAGSMVVGSAYDRNFEGTPLTTLFGIDLTGGSLVRQGGVNGVPSPNGGVITPVGPLGVTPDNGNVGFDIQGGSNTAFAAMTVGGVTRLFTVNLTTGAATPVGAIGTGAGGVLGLAVVPDGILVFGPDSGPGPHQQRAPLVRVFDALTQTLKFDILAFRRKFKRGVRVGSGDVNRDGIPDIITGPGAGVRAHVKVFDGSSGALIYNFRAFGPHYTLGIYVAGGDVNNDGFDDIIVGTAEGGGGHVKVFSGRDLTLLHSFLAYGRHFKGGVRVGAGDVNGDRVADILTGPGEGKGTRLKVFSGVDLTLLCDFVVYGPRFKGGLQVTTAFIDGDNRADIVTGPGVGGHGNFRVTRAVDNQLISSFLAYGPTYQGGLQVGAVDVNGDGRADVLGGPTPDRISQTVVFDPLTQTRLSSFVVYDPSFKGGLFVAAGR